LAELSLATEKRHGKDYHGDYENEGKKESD
jgi:hypothetical protein